MLCSAGDRLAGETELGIVIVLDDVTVFALRGPIEKRVTPCDGRNDAVGKWCDGEMCRISAPLFSSALGSIPSLSIGVKRYCTP